MSFSPLASFCSSISSITNAAFLLSLPELPGSAATRDDIYLDACVALNACFNKGEIDEVFFDYLCMHLDYAFSQGGTHE